MAVGAYLLLMALGGYYVREIGGDWGRVGQIVFFAGALVVLVCLVASAALRRHARVFISKHFYRNKYDYRVEWLRFIDTLSASDEDRRAAHGDPRDRADLREPRRHAVHARRGAAGASCRRRRGRCSSSELDGSRTLPARRRPAALSRAHAMDRRPAGVPAHAGRVREHRRCRTGCATDAQLAHRVAAAAARSRWSGFVLLYDPPPPFELTYEDRDLLKTVGRHVATHLAQHEADRRLAESRQFEAYNRLTAFMMHDLKNSVAQLQLIVANAERHKRNPEFIDDAIEHDRQHGRAHDAADRAAAGPIAPDRGCRQWIWRDLRARGGRTLQRARRPCRALQRRPAAPVRADPERLTAVIEHVIRNAQDATPRDGSGRRVEVRGPTARGAC